MVKIRKFINNLSKSQKITCFVLAVFLITVIAIAIPTLAEPNNDPIISTLNIWDGTVASSYKGGDGTEENPYIISDGRELAYLSKQLENTDYENTYFILDNDILLNEGILKYDLNDGLIYILNNVVYYIEEYSDSYYATNSYINEIDTINIFPSLEGFKGTFLGNNKTIYGAYITDENKEELGLFVNLEGVIDNLSVTNSLINGGLITAGIASSATNAKLTNILFDGYVKGKNTAGIIGKSDNVEMNNIINKADIFGEDNAAGIVYSPINSLKISNSYNTGDITGNVTGGLISFIENSDVEITTSYNTGNVSSNENSGGLIGEVINNPYPIDINNTFNTIQNFSVGTIENSIVNISNSYHVYENPVAIGEITGEFTLKTIEELSNKDNLITMFKEYNEEDTTINAWVYTYFDYPVIYIDNNLDPIVNIYTGKYMFNKYNPTPDIKNYKSNITFLIESADVLRPIDEISYYISNSSIVLTKEELELVNWTSYANIDQINSEGQYILYAKVIDYKNNVFYLNTDVLILDFTNPTATVTLNENTSWNNLRTSLQSIEITDEKQILINANDESSGIDKISYFVSNSILNITQLNEINEEDWIIYENGIGFRNGTNIFYIKIQDMAGNITYLNTDYLIVDGYDFKSIYAGRKLSSYDTYEYINDKSIITMNFEYDVSNASDITNYTHNLISNILLPNKTKITLYDHIKNKIYKYQITTTEDIYNYANSCEPLDINCSKTATYPFTLFTEIGNRNNDLYYEESSYFDNGSISEDFTIMLDFSETNINSNLTNVKLYLELQNLIGTSLRTTPSGSIIPFNIMTNSNATLTTTTNTNPESITLNRNSYTEINVTNNLIYGYLEDKKIIDTRHEDKKVSLNIKLTNSSGTVIAKDFYEQMTIKIGDISYIPDHNNIIRIPINSLNLDTILKIETNEHDSYLSPGIYYLNITSYLSYDGLYENGFYSLDHKIPVVVLNNNIVETHSFDVVLNSKQQIINKTDINYIMDFKLNLIGNFNNPSIRVTLYEKDDLIAQNQNYSIIDLQNYISNSLTKIAANTYSIPIDQTEFTLNLNTSNLDYNGYKLVFELYDDDKLIDSVKKHFIVK